MCTGFTTIILTCVVVIYCITLTNINQNARLGVFLIAFAGIYSGDIVTFSRTKDKKDYYEYCLIQNKTAEAIKKQGIAWILKDFNKAERNRLLFLADQIRSGLVK